MFIGLDLGTSGLKALLMDESGVVLGDAHAPLTVQRPNAGWSEQNPADWLTATQKAMTALGAEHDLSAVRGIGLAGHMHGATVLDKAHNVLRPCILWNDTRSHAEAAQMDADPAFRAVTGNIVFPGFTAPKLAWLRANEPQVFDQTALVLLPKDYLRLWLTGEAASEMSDAAGTAWLDTGARDWSDDLLTKTGLGRENMPRLVEGSAPSGTLRAELASAWGLGTDVVVAGGGGDNAASAIGIGAVRPGTGFLSLGTSGVVFAPTASYSPQPETAVHSFCHAVPDTWHQMGVILAAADALEWYAKLTGSTPAALTEEISGASAPGSALFLPYLGGERTPHNDARIRGVFTGLEQVTDRAAGTRAVLEGVAFAFRDSLDAMAASGTKIDRLIAVGGGSRSTAWLEIIATALNCPIEVPVAGDFGAGLGAARLAQMAATGAGVEIAQTPEISRRIAPNTALSDSFAAAKARYRATYQALKGIH
ncbi:xylulokinase [Alphaproteobacteria bacterium KMM 3653]|uniref:Xylulose kinase n=1 Tax=Harenicola maris TaxID=2841044 RepID=A0AAP2CL78_9RHOB|nr:xylulokinase [Harenicola maris]